MIAPSRRCWPVVLSHGHQADVAHQLLGAGEALEVGDLCAQPDRRERVDPAQAAQPADLQRPRRAGQQRGDLALELVAAMHERVDRAAWRRAASPAPPASPAATVREPVAVTLASTPARRRSGCRGAAAACAAGAGSASDRTRTASRARTRSRSASSSGPGTRTACSLPASSSRTSSSASRRSVFTRSPDARGILLGAATTHSHAAARELAREPVPGRPGLIRGAHRPRQPGAQPGRLADVTAAA